MKYYIKLHYTILSKLWLRKVINMQRYHLESGRQIAFALILKMGYIKENCSKLKISVSINNISQSAIFIWETTIGLFTWEN